MGVLTLLTCSGDLFALSNLNKICNTFGFPLLTEVEKYGEQTCKSWSMWSVPPNTTHCSSSLEPFHSSLVIFQKKCLVFISVYLLLLFMCLFLLAFSFSLMIYSNELLSVAYSHGCCGVFACNLVPLKDQTFISLIPKSTLAQSHQMCFLCYTRCRLLCWSTGAAVSSACDSVRL